MAYEQLKTDIMDILKSKDNNLEIKMYDQDGNLTLSTDEVEWLYIPNKKMIITMPNDENQKLMIGKNDIDFDESMNRVLRGIRKQCNLNGVEMVVRKYSGLDKRKVYNIVKSNMYESTGNQLAKMIVSLKGFRPNSAAFLPIEAKMNQTNALCENVLNIIKKMPFGKNQRVVESIQVLLNPEMKNIVERYNKFPEEIRKELTENLSDINSAFEFSKNQYNIYGKKTESYPIVKLNEYVKVMKVDEAPMLSNMQKATEYLMRLSEGVKTRYDLLRIIRDNHICEDYLVSKEALLESWISGKVVKTSWSYLIETANGEERIVDNSYSLAIDKLMRVIKENKGQYDSVIMDTFISENVRLNNLVDFTRKYRNNKLTEKYIPIAAKLCKEAIEYFTGNKIEPDIHLNSSNEEAVALLEVSVGTSHPAFDEVVANYEVKMENERIAALNETKRERDILVKEFGRYFKKARAEQLAECVLGGQICMLPDVSVSDNVSMGITPTNIDCGNATTKEVVQNWKKNFYMIDPVVRQYMDDYLSCKCYQTEAQLVKFKPIMEIISKYIHQ